MVYALNHLPREFWKPNQKYAWTLKENLYFFDLRLSNISKMYQVAFERYLTEKKEIEKAALQCEIGKTVFQCDVADTEELPSNKRTQQFGKQKDVKWTTDIVKSVMLGKLGKGSLAKRWSAFKSIGFWSICGARRET